MKKIIAIFVMVLMLTVCLVACNETPDNNAPCTHADANYDAKCDSCGADMDVVRTIADAEAWNNAVMFNNSDNYIVRWDTVFPEGEELIVDGYEYIVQFDGVTRKVEVKYFALDDNGKKEYVHEYEGMSLGGMTLVTKVDNKYYEYLEYDGESMWSETDQEYYDGFMSECITSWVYDMFDQFAFNETTGQYEYTEDGEHIKIAFINGVMTGFNICFDDDGEPIVVEITHGGVETIEYPEIPDNIDGNGGGNTTTPCTHADANYDAKCDTCGADMDVDRTIADAEAWHNAVMFNNSDNYIVRWDTVLPESEEIFDGYEYIVQFDGVTRKVEVKYFALDVNGEKEYVHEYEGMSLGSIIIVTKVGDKYYEYLQDGEVMDWNEATQEYYDNFMDEIIMSVCIDMFEQFTYNETTGQYEYTEDGLYIKIAFINGVMTGFSMCSGEDEEPIVAEITHGGVETIEYPEIPDDNDGNGGGNTTTPCTHTDANDDAKCDSCGADMDVVRTIADAEAWNNAVMFRNSDNYIVKWDTVLPESEEIFDGYEYMVQFDGVTRKVELKYFALDVNGEKEYITAYDGIIIVTKVGDKYYEYYEQGGEVMGWNETTQEYYDNFMDESITGALADMFEQFTYNETTGQYEFTAGGEYVKIAFINGVMTGFSIFYEGCEEPIVVEIAYGGVETIEYPEIDIE